MLAGEPLAGRRGRRQGRCVPSAQKEGAPYSLGHASGGRSEMGHREPPAWGMAHAAGISCSGLQGKQRSMEEDESKQSSERDPYLMHPLQA